MKFHFHKWITTGENHCWLVRECKKCGKKQEIRKSLQGYQPKP